MRRSSNKPKPDENPVWDPGGLTRIKVTEQVYSVIAVSDASVEESMETEDGPGGDFESRTELDSHANMPVIGANAYILADLQKTAEVSPFTPDYKSMEIPIVDAAVLYECPYNGEMYILVIRNALYVPAMRHNLLPPFILREHGVQVSEVPKIQTKDPTTEDSFERRRSKE